MSHTRTILSGSSLLMLAALFVGCSGGEGEDPNDTIVIVDDTEDMATIAPDMATSTPDMVISTPDMVISTPDMSRPVPVSTCGDGTLDAQEACDDGNTLDGDGCSSECNLETVVIRNLEAQLTRAQVIENTDYCGSSREPCNADYSMSFTLQNYTELAVDRLTYIRLTMGGHNITRSDYSCEFFQLPALGRSQVADVSISYVRDVNYYNDENGEIAMRNFCGEDRTLKLNFSQGLLNPVPLDGEIIELQLEGVLEDGALWSATAQTSIKDRR